MDDLRLKLAGLLEGRYDVGPLLGEGGMALVYGATDLRHGRRVAIKVLRPELSAVIGADRFLQEVKLTALLQHPHILPLFDSGVAGELLYYVMPLVEGESLRQRLTREGALPIDDAVRLIRAAAEALAYAHRQGVVHRDLKPENILLHEGQPLIADFGVALAAHVAGRERLTATGLAVGTPQYMSPEQATGGTVDRRSDVFALGCIAYEVLAGEPPHTGPNAQAVISALATRDPRPLDEVRRSTPPHVVAAVHHALQRLPADRFSSAQEFADALGNPEWRPSGAHRQQPAPRATWPMAVALIAGLALGLAAGFGVFRASPDAPEVTRLWNLVLPDSAPLALSGPAPIQGWPTALALSPGGRALAYVASTGTGQTRLHVRRLDGDSTVALPGTDGAYAPFFSPDGEWIGFFASGTLKKVAVSGGSPVTLARVGAPTGAAWTSDDRILVLDETGFGLVWVPAGGGTPSTPIRIASQFHGPRLLPGERWASGHLQSGQVALLSLDDGALMGVTLRGGGGVVPIDSVRPDELLRGANPTWVATGHLIYVVGDGVLTALPFDGKARRVLGPPSPVLDSVRIEDGVGYAAFAASTDGTLVYARGGNQNAGVLAWLDRAGRLDTLPFPRASQTQLRLSPDAGRIAVQLLRPSDDAWDVWVYDLATGQRSRVPVDPQYRAFPALWSADGREIMMGIWDPIQFINRGAHFYTLAGAPRRRIPVEGIAWMTASPNGRDFAYSDWKTSRLSVHAFDSDTASYHLTARGGESSFSPNGRWLAFRDTDGGISVSALPPDGVIHKVVERGVLPLWSPRGDRLFYRDGRRFYQVEVSTAGGFRTGPPSLFADGPFVRTFAWNYAVGPDGRLLVIVAAPDQRKNVLHVLTGLHTRLRSLATP